jgi:hypothetical protein
MAKVRHDVPEQGAAVDAAVAKVQSAFTGCDPLLRAAASVTSAEDDLRAAAAIGTG